MIFINGISYYLPEKKLSNRELNELFPDWSVEKIAAKTGIVERHIAAEDEFSSGMAVKAAQKLFKEYQISPDEIEFVLLCTQSPDYLLPTTACIVQDLLGIPTTVGAMDYNLGCSGYIYGLSTAKGLIQSGDVSNVLLLTSETYSKHLAENDKSVRTIFGDAASATLISRKRKGASIGKTSFGTDGKGAANLILKRGGARNINCDLTGSNEGKLFMNGAEIFTFTLKVVPAIVEDTLKKNELKLDNIDLFIFHQANKYMLEHLRMKMNIPEDKFYVHISHCGNTVSSTIPIALKAAEQEGYLKPGMTVMLTGFGVGYSWGASIIHY
ncbi:3-oxoacyl-[acyl-carrier-protein] synthase-3 [Chitinophaga terrae (ex Kim and Jung 2007)]|uniref:3-oxoacyl-[acyl-carrier-protein] synthase-3 n=1 Tax=Chitinophaga terrae (ex Kim and Jung 2007) TaxID=408074 RepID=A0A1H3XZ95_9BACT|nr:ketoacyl-ACP synthase III [Chitinophaga terrae (ex Kim and Jung 2007)]GEP89446.1 3-oxoacyl-ACP synthase [Chitinophaga terrae (ex Kim and Jung 2007)]SEA03872.1 3-oxoacyl-[acyl-carrier-protein] synthase-3 [Chitinophaga terrae (ex Kim and Jung 2007)]